MNLPDDVPSRSAAGLHRPAAAVILAGGRSSRLGGMPKAALRMDADGGTLLALTVAAAAAALNRAGGHYRGADCAGAGPSGGAQPAAQPGGRPGAQPGAQRGKPRIAVVGPAAELRGLVPDPDSVLWIREEPPFSGPAAGLAAGLEALAATPAGEADELVLVLACDMPGIAAALDALLAAPPRVESGGSLPDGWLAVDGDRDQPLAALYRLAPLCARVEDSRARGRLENGSIFRLVASLDLTRVAVPPRSTADVDTWADAQTLGVHPGSREDQP